MKVELSNNEKDFVLDLLKQETRVDGRKLLQFRDVEITFGESLGHVEVSLGKTKVIVRVSAEVTKPYEDRPYEGIFLMTTDVSSMASPIFENNRQSDEETLISRVIEKAIRRSNALDVESLCIAAGKACWMVRADVHFINYDGGLIDATCIGAIAALMHYRRPDTSIDGDRVIVHPIEERAPVPLSILHVPLCVTFSFFDDSIMLVDATAQEEALRTSEMVITLNKNREVCQMLKPGGRSIDAVEVINCANIAYQTVVELTDMIHRRLKEDDKIRNRGNIVNLSAENKRE
uniref:Exosome complex component RRP45 n=1 Tax=Blastobotrys adeninivorans TaxID=409370 RepID=A0A060TJJ4_BLAAD